MKRNPLHSLQYVTNVMCATGEYFDPSRGSGRTTAIALKTIAMAIENPWEWVGFRDHHDSPEATTCLAHTMQGMINDMGLEQFTFRKHGIRFGRD